MKRKMGLATVLTLLVAASPASAMNWGVGAGVGFGMAHGMAGGHGRLRLDARYDRIRKFQENEVSIRLGFDLWNHQR
jgi:hypothetical protein